MKEVKLIVQEDGAWVIINDPEATPRMNPIDGFDDLCDRITAKYHIFPYWGFTIMISTEPTGGMSETRMDYICAAREGFTYDCDGEAVWLDEHFMKLYDLIDQAQPAKSIYLTVKEAEFLQEAKDWLKEQGYRLVYTPDVDLIDDELWVPSIDGFLKYLNNYHIDWLNYQLYKVGEASSSTAAEQLPSHTEEREHGSHYQP